MHFETDACEFFRRKNISSVEQKRRLLHVLMHAMHIELLELIPFGHHRNRMGLV